MKYIFEELIKKYFWFLVMEYGFSFKENTFTSDELEIRFTLERKHVDIYYPGITFNRAREADCPVLPFDWILNYLDETTDIKFKQSLDENMRYFSDLLKRYSHRLFFDVDKWWIPAHKYRLKIWEDMFQSNHLVAFQEVYDYIKAKEGK